MSRRFLFAIAVLAIYCDTGLQRRPVSAASPRRVISLVPATTEILFAMGQGDRLIGVGAYDLYPPETRRLPKLGGLLDPNVERIFALKPDLVILYSTQVELRRQLDGVGIPTFPYIHRDLRDVSETIRTLGARIDAVPSANALANLVEARLAAIRARVDGRPRPKTLLVIGREAGSLRGVFASGGYGFLHDMLEIAGAIDILGDINRESVQMSTEMILARAPEVIIELHYGGDLKPDQLESERSVWNRLGSLPAVKTKRVHLLVGNEFVVPGPRVAAATERLARTLHPEAWGKP